MNQQPANGLPRPAASPASGTMPIWAIGFPLKSLDDIIMDLKRAEFPREYILHPIQFQITVSQIQQSYPAFQLHREPTTGEAYFWFSNTKLKCAAPRDAVVDVSDEPERRIVAP